MIEFKKVFIDTAPFIYYIESSESNFRFHDKVKKFFMGCYENDIEFYTSVITVEEYLVFPYKHNKQIYIDIFKKLIHDLGIQIIEIDKVIAEEAAKIRAEYQAFKAMDALQLASACIQKCDLFLTNDKQLRQFKEIKCITIDELE